MEPKDRPSFVVSWQAPQTGCIFSLTLLLVVICLPVIAFGDFDSGLLRHRWIALLIQSLSFRGIPVGAILFTLYMAWEAKKHGWRWADGWAVRSSESGLEVHKSLRLKPLKWDEVHNLSIFSPKSQWLTKQKTSVVIKYTPQGKTYNEKTVHGVDWQSSEAKMFIERSREKDKMS